MKTSTLFNQAQLRQCAAPRRKAQPRVYGLNDVFLFGKYQRQMLRAIAIQDPDYLEYLAARYKVQLAPEVIAFVKQMKFYSK